MDFENDIVACIKVLNSGGLILYPTDTVWGIGCDATDAAAVEKIYRLKQRSDSKSMIVLVADERDVLQYVSAPDLAVFDYLEAQTQPTTVVYENGIGLADNVLADDGSVGMRMTADPFCRALIKRFGKPIVSTSANISGDAPAPYFEKISAPIKNGVDYIVQWRQDDTRPATASRVIKWKEGEVVVLRG